MRWGSLAVLLIVGLGAWALFDAWGFYQGRDRVVRWVLFGLVVLGALLASRGPPQEAPGD